MQISLDKNISDQELLLLSREISVHHGLDHPHVIKLWGVLACEKRVYMVMDYASNGNLFRFLVQKRGLSEPQAAKYFYQIASAVRYLHGQNVFHRDIKVF